MLDAVDYVPTVYFNRYLNLKYSLRLFLLTRLVSRKEQYTGQCPTPPPRPKKFSIS